MCLCMYCRICAAARLAVVEVLGSRQRVVSPVDVCVEMHQSDILASWDSVCFM
jgi:hypothetical protein